MKLHPETIACTNLEVAKVFVNVDVSKALPKEITFTKEGKQFTVAYYYPWLPARCKFCEKWGHGESVCAMKGKEKKQREGVSQSVQKKSVEKSTRYMSYVKERGPSSGESFKEIVKNTEEIGNDNTGDVPNESSGIKEQEAELKDSNASMWSSVLPAKVGRSPTSNVQEAEILISASKFSVPVDDKEEGEFVEDAIESNKELEESESELLEDDRFEQQVNEEAKIRKRRGRKPKAQDVNPKSTRTSRQNH